MRFFLLCKPIAIIQQLMEEPINEGHCIEYGALCV